MAFTEHYSVRGLGAELYIDGKKFNEADWDIVYEGENDDQAEVFGVYKLNDPVKDGVTWEWIADFKYRSDAEMFALEKESDLKTGGIDHECGN